MKNYGSLSALRENFNEEKREPLAKPRKGSGACGAFFYAKRSIYYECY